MASPRWIIFKSQVLIFLCCCVWDSQVPVGAKSQGTSSCKIVWGCLVWGPFERVCRRLAIPHLVEQGTSQLLSHWHLSAGSRSSLSMSASEVLLVAWRVAEGFLLPPGAVPGTGFSLNTFLPNRTADRLCLVLSNVAFCCTICSLLLSSHCALSLGPSTCHCTSHSGGVSPYIKKMVI